MDEQVRATLELVLVEPQPTFIESSARWRWPLPKQAQFPGCCTSVVTASREWWEYAPSEAKPHPFASALQHEQKWYWVVSSSAAPSEAQGKPPGEDAWLDEFEEVVSFAAISRTRAGARDKLRTLLRAYRANLLNNAPSSEREQWELVVRWREFTELSTLKPDAEKWPGPDSYIEGRKDGRKLCADELERLLITGCAVGNGAEAHE